MSILETHPDIAKQWSPNNAIEVSTITHGSDKKVLWVCHLGHEWESKISDRTIKKRNCPYCANQKVLEGFNDLATTHPDIVLFWSKNNTIKPNEVTYGSNKKVLWVCSNGHEYTSSIKIRCSRENLSCPICSNYKVIPGINDLKTTNPELAKDWSPKNKIKIEEVHAGSLKKVLWLCPQGHEYEQPVVEHTRGQRCGYCAGKLILTNFNDFASKYPELISQWSYKNTIKPTEISYGSAKKIWRKCPAGRHEDWQQQLKGWPKYGCPKCNTVGGRISFGEQEVAYFVESLGFEIEQTNKTALDGLHLDIYIKDFKIGIEYNGTYYHGPKFPQHIKRDKKKKDLCNQKGISLIVVKEEDWTKNNQKEKLRIKNSLRKYM